MYKNMITLLDKMGSDLTVVNSARVSFNKESDWEYGDKTIKTSYDWNDGGKTITEKEKTVNKKDIKLINYLAKHKHWTPFSQCQIQFRIKMPIFIARQWYKHMIGFTRNEVSRRYVSDEPNFFIPDGWREKPPKNMKQGSGIDLDDLQQKRMHQLYSEYLNESIRVYETMLNSGVCPEQARIILPQSMFTEFIETGSLAAYARLYRLRNEKLAQREIQEYAKVIGDVLEKEFPISWTALIGDNNE